MFRKYPFWLFREFTTTVLDKSAHEKQSKDIFFFFIPGQGSSIVRRRRRWWWRPVTEGIFNSFARAVILWKSIMPVGGRVAGKGVGVYNSEGSSDDKSTGMSWSWGNRSRKGPVVPGDHVLPIGRFPNKFPLSLRFHPARVWSAYSCFRPPHIIHHMSITISTE